jgi:hypothetical protein
MIGYNCSERSFNQCEYDKYCDDTDNNLTPR